MKLMMAANWKMHKTRREAVATLTELLSQITPLPEDRQVVVFAPFTALSACAEALRTARNVLLGGQNCYPAGHGAFTGEISPDMLRDCGCTHVLTGHSERRSLMGESSEFIGQKTAFALSAGLKPLICIGETLEERDSGRLETVLNVQLSAGLADVPDTISADDLAVAYEPVWAIGTGRVAGIREILDAHEKIRICLQQRFPSQGGEIRILYGGSVNPENTGEIISLDNVNGVLVGGASLQAESFRRIALA